MLFLNPWMLLGLLGVLVPIIIHLVRRQAAKPFDWGAMRFLMDTIVVRRRRMEWEDLLLMATRCLLIGLVALALARPFVPPDSKVPWLIVLPLALLGIAGFGASFVLSSAMKRWLMRLVAVAMLLGAGALVYFEKQLNMQRFQTSSRRDVALIIDGSTSMTMGNSFEKALASARSLVKEAPKGTAFTVVLGGPTPELMTETPLSHRADVLEVLDGLRPVEGPFRAHEALGMATVSLAKGSGAAKELIVFSDGQRVGWKLESPSAWESLGDAWEGLPAKPRLMTQTFAFPEHLRNVSVSGIEMSREVVGTDREVTFRVTLENTGTETMTPGLITLDVAGQSLEPQSVGQLIPGQEEVVEFRYQFGKPGLSVVVARVEGDDDLAGDDVYERAVSVRKRLPVLLVDGNPSGGFFDRATGYTALALAPTSALISGEKAEGGYLMEPSVVSALDVSSVDFAEQAVVVLGDVARLPSGAASRLSDFVLKGGGLMILSGEKMDAPFYNEWRGNGGGVTPLAVDEMLVLQEAVSPSATTFDHPMLDLFEGRAGADLEEATVQARRKVNDLNEGGLVAARYSDGEPFIGVKDYGQGRVMMVTTGLDARYGNIPVRQTFVPLVHEMVTWLAGGRELELNIDARWNPSLTVPGEMGLQATYYRWNNNKETKLLEKIDPAVDYNWGGDQPDRKLPRDQFKVVWKGSLVPPMSGDYVFSGVADDRLVLTIDDEEVMTATREEKGRSKAIELEKGKAVAVEIEFVEEWGDAYVSLTWTRPDAVTEVIPSLVFRPVDAGSAEKVLAEARAVDPRGEARKTRLLSGQRGKILEVNGSAVPGIYQLDVPEGMSDDLEAGEGKLPLVVKREVRESRLSRFSDDDFALVRSEIDLVETSSHEDILGVLTGKGFGRELWKILAIAAFALLLLECALARWVSASRKIKEETGVDFSSQGEPDADSWMNSNG